MNKNESDETNLQPQAVPEESKLLDFDSDEPLVCNRDQSGDTTCESCQ